MEMTTVQVDQYVAVVAFVYFGVKLLRDSYRAPDRCLPSARPCCNLLQAWPLTH
jgi:hypothetical protein